MIDMFGKTIVPGDKVIFVAPTGGSYRSDLKYGVVKSLRASETQAVVEYSIYSWKPEIIKTTYLNSCNILKYDWTSDLNNQQLRKNLTKNINDTIEKHEME